jgi:hypothetical protein
MRLSGGIVILAQFAQDKNFDQNVLCLSKSSDIAPRIVVKIINQKL